MVTEINEKNIKYISSNIENFKYYYLFLSKKKQTKPMFNKWPFLIHAYTFSSRNTGNK